MLHKIQQHGLEIYSPLPWSSLSLRILSPIRGLSFPGVTEVPVVQGQGREGSEGSPAPSQIQWAGD